MIEVATYKERLRSYSRFPRPDLSEREIRLALPPKKNPYWGLLAINRLIGYEKKHPDETYWLARWRSKEGKARQRRLAVADDHQPADGIRVLNFEQALASAANVFSDPAISSEAADTKPVQRSFGLIYSPIGDVFTVGHALEEMLEWKKLANAPSHTEVLFSVVNHHLMPRIGTLAAEEVTAHTARRLVQDILETPVGAKPDAARVSILSMDIETLRKRRKTANNVVSILREALRMAWEDGHVSSDRCWRVLRTTRLPYFPRALFFSEEEVARLTKATPEDLRQLVFGALYTGCRVGELLRMQVRDVAHEGYGVTVQPGGKQRSGRFVYLCDEGMAYFLGLASGRAPDAPLFVRADGSQWTVGVYPRELRKALTEAELDSRYCFHCLRHTYASTLIRRGATLNTIADQLGHANTVQVMRTYGHLAPQSRGAEVRQLFPSLSPVNAEHAKSAAGQLAALRERFSP